MEEVGPLELAGMVVVDVGDADHLAAADEREAEHGPMPPAEVLLPLELADTRVDGDVLRVHGLPGVERRARQPQLLERVLGAHVVRVRLAVIDAGDTAERVAVQGEDVAVGRGGGGAEAAGDAQEDFVPVQRRPELDAALHQQAERLVAVLEPLHEQRVLERAGHHLADAQQEVAVLRVVAPPVVVHVEQADDPVVQHERHADLALRARVRVQPPLVVAQPRIVRALDDQRRLLGDGHPGAGEEVEVERPVRVVVQELAVVVGQDAVQRVVAKDEDLAPVRLHELDDARADCAHELAEAAGVRDRPAQLDELGERRVAALELVEQQGVLDGSGGRLPDAAQEVEVLAVVARPRVEHVDEADHPVAADERDAELALVAVLGHVLALLVGEVRVVEAGDGHGLARAHGKGRRREPVDVEDVADDAGVEPARGRR